MIKRVIAFLIALQLALPLPFVQAQTVSAHLRPQFDRAGLEDTFLPLATQPGLDEAAVAVETRIANLNDTQNVIGLSTVSDGFHVGEGVWAHGAQTLALFHNGEPTDRVHDLPVQNLKAVEIDSETNSIWVVDERSETVSRDVFQVDASAVGISVPGQPAPEAFPSVGPGDIVPFGGSHLLASQSPESMASMGSLQSFGTMGSLNSNDFISMMADSGWFDSDAGFSMVDSLAASELSWFDVSALGMSYPPMARPVEDSVPKVPSFPSMTGDDSWLYQSIAGAQPSTPEFVSDPLSEPAIDYGDTVVRPPGYFDNSGSMDMSSADASVDSVESAGPGNSIDAGASSDSLLMSNHDLLGLSGALSNGPGATVAIADQSMEDSVGGSAESLAIPEGDAPIGLTGFVMNSGAEFLALDAPAEPHLSANGTSDSVAGDALVASDVSVHLGDPIGLTGLGLSGVLSDGSSVVGEDAGVDTMLGASGDEIIAAPAMDLSGDATGIFVPKGGSGTPNSSGPDVNQNAPVVSEKRSGTPNPSDLDIDLNVSAVPGTTSSPVPDQWLDGSVNESHAMFSEFVRLGVVEAPEVVAVSGTQGSILGNLIESVPPGSVAIMPLEGAASQDSFGALIVDQEPIVVGAAIGDVPVALDEPSVALVRELETVLVRFDATTGEVTGTVDLVLNTAPQDRDQETEVISTSIPGETVFLAAGNTVQAFDMQQESLVDGTQGRILPSVYFGADEQAIVAMGYVPTTQRLYVVYERSMGALEAEIYGELASAADGDEDYQGAVRGLAFKDMIVAVIDPQANNGMGSILSIHLLQVQSPKDYAFAADGTMYVLTEAGALQTVDLTKTSISTAAAVGGFQQDVQLNDAVNRTRRVLEQSNVLAVSNWRQGFVDAEEVLAEDGRVFLVQNADGVRSLVEVDPHASPLDVISVAPIGQVNTSVDVVEMSASGSASSETVFFTETLGVEGMPLRDPKIRSYVVGHFSPVLRLPDAGEYILFEELSAEELKRWHVGQTLTYYPEGAVRRVELQIVDIRYRSDGTVRRVMVRERQGDQLFYSPFRLTAEYLDKRYGRSNRQMHQDRVDGLQVGDVLLLSGRLNPLRGLISKKVASDWGFDNGLPFVVSGVERDESGQAVSIQVQVPAEFVEDPDARKTYGLTARQVRRNLSRIHYLEAWRWQALMTVHTILETARHNGLLGRLHEATTEVEGVSHTALEYLRFAQIELLSQYAAPEVVGFYLGQAILALGVSPSTLVDLQPDLVTRVINPEGTGAQFPERLLILEMQEMVSGKKFAESLPNSWANIYGSEDDTAVDTEGDSVETGVVTLDGHSESLIMLDDGSLLGSQVSLEVSGEAGPTDLVDVMATNVLPEAPFVREIEMPVAGADLATSAVLVHVESPSDMSFVAQLVPALQSDSMALTISAADQLISIASSQVTEVSTSAALFVDWTTVGADGAPELYFVTDGSDATAEDRAVASTVVGLDVDSAGSVQLGAAALDVGVTPRLSDPGVLMPEWIVTEDAGVNFATLVTGDGATQSTTSVTATESGDGLVMTHSGTGQSMTIYGLDDGRIPDAILSLIHEDWIQDGALVTTANVPVRVDGAHDGVVMASMPATSGEAPVLAGLLPDDTLASASVEVGVGALGPATAVDISGFVIGDAALSQAEIATSVASLNEGQIIELPGELPEQQVEAEHVALRGWPKLIGPQSPVEEQITQALTTALIQVTFAYALDLERFKGKEIITSKLPEAQWSPGKRFAVQGTLVGVTSLALITGAAWTTHHLGLWSLQSELAQPWNLGQLQATSFQFGENQVPPFSMDMRTGATAQSEPMALVYMQVADGRYQLISQEALDASRRVNLAPPGNMQVLDSGKRIVLIQHGRHVGISGRGIPENIEVPSDQPLLEVLSRTDGLSDVASRGQVVFIQNQDSGIQVDVAVDNLSDGSIGMPVSRSERSSGSNYQQAQAWRYVRQADGTYARHSTVSFDGADRGVALPEIPMSELPKPDAETPDWVFVVTPTNWEPPASVANTEGFADLALMTQPYMAVSTGMQGNALLHDQTTLQMQLPSFTYERSHHGISLGPLEAVVYVQGPDGYTLVEHEVNNRTTTAFAIETDHQLELPALGEGQTLGDEPGWVILLSSSSTQNVGPQLPRTLSNLAEVESQALKTSGAHIFQGVVHVNKDGARVVKDTLVTRYRLGAVLTPDQATFALPPNFAETFAGYQVRSYARAEHEDHYRWTALSEGVAVSTGAQTFGYTRVPKEVNYLVFYRPGEEPPQEIFGDQNSVTSYPIFRFSPGNLETRRVFLSADPVKLPRDVGREEGEVLNQIQAATLSSAGALVVDSSIMGLEELDALLGMHPGFEARIVYHTPNAAVARARFPQLRVASTSSDVASYLMGMPSADRVSVAGGEELAFEVANLVEGVMEVAHIAGYSLVRWLLALGVPQFVLEGINQDALQGAFEQLRSA